MCAYQILQHPFFSSTAQHLSDVSLKHLDLLGLLVLLRSQSAHLSEGWVLGKVTLYCPGQGTDWPASGQHADWRLPCPSDFVSEPWCMRVFRVMNFNWKLRPNLAREYVLELDWAVDRKLD